MAKPFTANSNWTMQRGYSTGSSQDKSAPKAPVRKKSEAPAESSDKK
jgi:hypothetical protein